MLRIREFCSQHPQLMISFLLITSLLLIILLRIRTQTDLFILLSLQKFQNKTKSVLHTPQTRKDADPTNQ